MEICDWGRKWVEMGRKWGGKRCIERKWVTCHAFLTTPINPFPNPFPHPFPNPLLLHSSPIPYSFPSHSSFPRLTHYRYHPLITTPIFPISYPFPTHFSFPNTFLTSPNSLPLNLSSITHCTHHHPFSHPFPSIYNHFPPTTIKHPLLPTPITIHSLPISHPFPHLPHSKTHF